MLYSQEILFISFHFIHHHLVGFFLPESLCQLDLIAIDLWQLGAVAFYALTGSHPCETRTLVFCLVKGASGLQRAGNTKIAGY